MTKIIWAGKAILDAETPVQSDFAVAVEGNRIIETGKKEDLIAYYQHAEVTGGENLLLTAAMVNSHDHGRIVGTASLGIPDDMLEIWLPRARTQPTIDPYTTGLYSGLRLLKTGVGSVVHQHRPRQWAKLHEEAAATIKGYRDAGIRVVFCILYADRSQLVYDDPASFVASLPLDVQKGVEPLLSPIPFSLEDYKDLLSNLTDKFHDVENQAVHISACTSGGEWSSDRLLTELVDFVQRKKVRFQMHLLETKFQKLTNQRRWGKSIEKHFAEIGVLGPWLTLAHMVWAELEDLPILVENKVGIAHNPGSNLRLRSGIAPLEHMMKAEIPVGIGLDGSALDDDYDFLRELRLAWILGNKPGAGAIPVSARDIWHMGTRGGAAVSFGPQAKLGRVIVGYLADLTLIDLDAVKGIWVSPKVDELEILMQHGTRQHVRHVMVNGKWVIKDGRSVTVNEEDLLATIRDQLDSQVGNVGQQKLTEAVQQVVPYLRKYYMGWENQQPDV